MKSLKRPQCYVDLMQRCCHNDPKKRPSATEICETITSWMHGLEGFLFDEKLGNDIMEFDKTDQVIPTKANPRAYHSRRFVISQQLNEILIVPVSEGQSLIITIFHI